MNKNDAKRWLEYAEKDLGAAHTLLESGEFFPRQICFLAQQAAEKSIKAILVFAEVDFPKTHDLDRLRDLIPAGWKFKELFPDLAELTIWSVESRYPGDTPDVVEREAREIFHLAESVFHSVKAELDEQV
jgi:HEPN domain-containing protein